MSENIELYRIMINTITANEQRRQQITSVNTSLMVAGAAALGGIEKLDPIYISLTALPLTMIWFFSIQYFRRLTKAKWAVAHEIEKQFEYKPFHDEWRKMKEKSNFLPFGLTHLEMIVPVIIFIVSLSYVVHRSICIIAA